jgi:cell division protein FtsW
MRKKRPDFILLFTILALVLSGLIMILSASSIKAEQLFSNSYYFFNNQLKYLVVAVIISLVIYKFKYEKLKKFGTLFTFNCAGLLNLSSNTWSWKDGRWFEKVAAFRAY